MAENVWIFNGCPPFAINVGGDAAACQARLSLLSMGFKLPTPEPFDWKALGGQVKQRLASRPSLERFREVRGRLVETERSLAAVETEIMRENVARRDALAGLAGEPLAVELARINEAVPALEL